MKNKIKIEGLNTQYSLIIVEKNCLLCEGNGNLKNKGFNSICAKCKGLGKIISKRIVSNNGWLPLLYWEKYFANDF